MHCLHCLAVGLRPTREHDCLRIVRPNAPCSVELHQSNHHCQRSLACLSDMGLGACQLRFREVTKAPTCGDHTLQPSRGAWLARGLNRQDLFGSSVRRIQSVSRRCEGDAKRGIFFQTTEKISALERDVDVDRCQPEICSLKRSQRSQQQRTPPASFSIVLSFF